MYTGRGDLAAMVGKKVHILFLSIGNLFRAKTQDLGKERRKRGVRRKRRCKRKLNFVGIQNNFQEGRKYPEHKEEGTQTCHLPALLCSVRKSSLTKMQRHRKTNPALHGSKRGMWGERKI